jgi:CRISPR-associated protein Csy1
MNSEKSMHEAIKSFILNRKEKKKETLLTTKLQKDKDGGLNKILTQEIQKHQQYDIEKLEEITSRKKAAEVSPLLFQLEKYYDLAMLADSVPVDRTALKEAYGLQMEKIANAHQFDTWLDYNCQFAEGTSVATHVSKLTHSSSKASCFFDTLPDKKQGYISTSCLERPVVDGAYDNAMYSPIVSLLLVEHGGRFFYEDVIDDNFDGIEDFAKSAEQLNNWKTQLKKAIDKPNKSTDSLAKQVYFPVTARPVENEDWHLLSVLVSSSLAQEVFNKTGSKEFSDKNKSLNDKFRKKSLYSPEVHVRYPQKATLKVTQSSHQNTSILNGKRSGRLFLLSCQPPVWQSQLKPPLYRKSWFTRGIPGHSVNEDIKYLRDFLLRFERLDLSTKDPKKREWLIKWVQRIVSNVMYHAESTQNLTPGWSDAPDIQLKPAHQYFLDPYRSDESFQAARKSTDWQTEVCADFASWLNWKLVGKEKKFTPQTEHSRLWKKLMEPVLRDSCLMIDAVLAEKKGEAE